MNWLDTLLDAVRTRRLRKSTAPLGGWQPKAVACWDCQMTHQLPTNIKQALVSAGDFFARHDGHQVNWHEAPGVAGLFHANADVKEAYGASAAYTITLTSLASSTTLIAGRESTAISNTSSLYSDYSLGGRITMGTVTPTVNTTIEVNVYGSVNDTPTYPDVLDGTDSDETFTSVYVKRSSVKLVERIFVDATASQVYWFGPVTLAQFFGGRVPKNHGLFVTQSSGQALHSTAGNHVLSYTGCFQTVI